MIGKQGMIFLCCFILGVLLTANSGCKNKSQKEVTTNQNGTETQTEDIKSEAQDDKSLVGDEGQGKNEQKAKILESIKKMSKPEDLEAHVDSLDPEILAAALDRLGQIGGKKSVEILGDAFTKAPRLEGTGVMAGKKGQIIKALAETGEPSAKQTILGIIESWLEEGPLDKGMYSHIYDGQYYAVLEAAIESLAAFPDSDTLEILKSVSETPSLFYSLRESAYRTLLAVEMKRRGLESSLDKISYLWTKIEPRGILIENIWTGQKPGEKTLEAAKQAAVEEMATRIGFDAAAPLFDFWDKLSPEEFEKQMALARILSSISIRALSSGNGKESLDKVKEIAHKAAAILERLPQDRLRSKTADHVFGYIQEAAAAIKDQELWDRLEKLYQRMGAPGAWRGERPAESQLGVAIPPGSVFIENYSRRIQTPFGTVLEAYYLSDLASDDITRHFENTTGKQAIKIEGPAAGAFSDTYYWIPLWPSPKEAEDLLELGVTVFESSEGFEVQRFGQTLQKGKTLFKITKLQ